MEEKEIINADQSIVEGYAMVMRDYHPVITSNWEMRGEYYKQFSLYAENYNTKVTNKVEEVCQVGVTF